jgi:putative transcriptional regulator
MTQDFLTGQLLIAMPNMGDTRFSRTVIYVCAHSEDGAMGLVINKPVEHISFPELLGQLGIEPSPNVEPIRIMLGGPVDTSRGFVLHTADYFTQDATLQVSGQVGLTATVDILRALAKGEGPRQSMLALGYAGWGPGQLEAELQANGWLHAPADLDLLFSTDDDGKWHAAIARLGIDASLLSSTGGHA